MYIYSLEKPGNTVHYTLALKQLSDHNYVTLCYLLGKGGYFGSIGVFVCLSICLWATLLKQL